MASRKRTAEAGFAQMAVSHASKRARLTDRTAMNIDPIRVQRDDNTPEEPSNESRSLSPAPCFAFTEPSIADVSMTSASTSKRPKIYVCDYTDCGKAFDRPVRLQMHVRSHTNERPYACEEPGCDKTFLRNEHLTRHVKDKHSEEKGYLCQYEISNSDGSVMECGKSFTTATRLRRHTAAHEAKEETTCPEPGCGKVFRKQETLQRHIKTDHLKEKPYTCNHVDTDNDGQSVACNKSFSKPSQLKNHQSREHCEKRFYCDLCTTGQSDQLFSVKADGPESELASDRVSFATYTDLQGHIKIEHPPTCSDCGKQCESSRALKAHMDIEHTSLSERQNFHCTWPGCTRAFTKAGNLKVHLQSVHMKARNFVCGTFDLTGNDKVAGWDLKGCGFAFGTKANLEEHVRTQHLGYPTKPKPCRLRKKVKAENESNSPSLMDMDEIATPSDQVSMLTGFGYQDSRHIPCLVTACTQHFALDSNLAQHLEFIHDWSAEAINDEMAERNALSGGNFWIGGGEPEEAEEVLRQRLIDALAHPKDVDVAERARQKSSATHSGLVPYHPDSDAQSVVKNEENSRSILQHHEDVTGMDDLHLVNMEQIIPVDPALMEATMSWE